MTSPIFLILEYCQFHIFIGSVGGICRTTNTSITSEIDLLVCFFTKKATTLYGHNFKRRWKWDAIVSQQFYISFLFLFSFADTDDSQNSRRREGVVFISLYNLHLLTKIQHLFAVLHLTWPPFIFQLQRMLLPAHVFLDEIYHFLPVIKY